MQKINFSKRFKIANRWVGQGEPVFIIAEIGVNHNGDMELAKKIIDAAASAGADAVKFQTFRTDSFMKDTGQMYEYVENGKKVQESTYAMLKRLEFPEKAHKEIFDYARARNLIPLTSVTELHSIDVANEAGSSCYKIASADLTNLQLLKAVCKEGKPLIISTGMTVQEELDLVCKTLNDYRLYEAVFLHCVSLYPTPASAANISRISTIANNTNSLVGYSDHTDGIEACVAAVALGACVLEKHFTLDKKLPGPDHAFSADPEELRELITRIHYVKKLLGNGNLHPCKQEQISRNTIRPSLTYSCNLMAGTMLEEKHICLKWPATGMHPSEMKTVLGLTLIKNVKKDEQVKLSALTK